MFVSVLCSILKYKLLLCFVFSFVVQNILSYLVSAKLVLSLPFFCPLCQCNLFTCPLDQYLKRFSIQFQGPEFFNSLSREIRNSESVGLLGKDLKGSFFLGHIYVVLFVELHTFSFLFFNLLINHFSLSICTINSHGVNYILRKPIVPQPLASTLYSCRVQRKSFLQLAIRAR